MNDTDLQELRALIMGCRQATLAVAERDEPFTAMVAYAEEPDLHGILIHLSNRASHKHQLLANPRCSLLIATPDRGSGEVMALARVTLQGKAAVIPQGTPDYEASRFCYNAKLPTSKLMFSLPDFDLIRITVARGRYVGGFGRIFDFTVEDL